MVYNRYKYSGDARTISTPRWYERNPIIDTPRLSKTYLGFVRDSRDPQKMGRLLVWIPELTGDANQEENWIICNYSTPFGGATFPRDEYYKDKGSNTVVETFYNESDGTQKHRTPINEKNIYGGRQSYGLWLPPPDIGNQVLVTFINGDANFAVWFGVLFQQDMNHMVPGIAKSNIFNGNTNDETGPVIEPDYKTNSGNLNDDSPKIAYTPLYNGLKYEQGLHEDDVRGQSTSSARRESPSEVFGILTPDGNQFVMDDSQDQEFIRLRTKSGTQLLIDQTDGIIYAISRDGRTWIELSNEGNIDIYGAESISVHAEKANINVKAGQDINLQADRDINMRAGGNFKLEVGKNIDIQCNENFTENSGLKTSIKSGGEMGINSGSNIGVTSGGDILLQGNKNIFLNTRPGPQANITSIPETYTPSSPSSTAGDQEPWVSGDPYTSGENIIPRVPQHEPWIEHKIATTGTNNNVAEGPLNPRIPTGATNENATKPVDITLPDGRRLEGKSITTTNQPEYIQVENVPDCALLPISQRQISSNGVDFIKQSEGVKNIVYKDQAGLDTIGVGHLITKEEKISGRFSSGTITDEETNALLLEDLGKTQRNVRGCVTQPITQEQYDSLVSMAFNIGTGNFCSSTLVKKINEGNYKEVPNQMLRWNKVKANGILTESAGLTNRRRAEANLFAKAPAPCE